jgi:hypothetical protein
MEDQTNGAFWQSQINFEDFSEFVGASDSEASVEA